MILSHNKALVFFTIFLLLSGLLGSTASGGDTMKIQITFEGHSINIELNNSSTSKAFYEQLPLNAKMEDYASNEKIFYPLEKLSTLGTPKGYEPKLGDVAYYSPWGNVAVFYKNFSYSDGLIKMGEIISGHEFLKKLNGTQVRIEKLKN